MYQNIRDEKTKKMHKIIVKRSVKRNGKTTEKKIIKKRQSTSFLLYWSSSSSDPDGVCGNSSS